GDLETGPEDLGRMLLVQYALTFGDDWFQVPVDLDVGSLLSVGSVVVTDTFGVRSRIPSAAAVDGSSGGWRLFSLDRGVTPARHDSGSHLFLPPVLGGVERGTPVEEVHLLRDEFANLAWAVEQRVEGARGRGYDRYEASRHGVPAPAASPDPGQTDADLTYRL